MRREEQSLPRANKGTLPMNPLGGDLWGEITTSPWVLEQIRSGVTLDFISQPLFLNKPIRNPVPPNRQSDMNILIQELVDLEVIHKVSPCNGQLISPIFLTDKKPEGFRFILNLKFLNKFLSHEKFKMETLKMGLDLVSRDCWMAKIDLKNAYYSVRMAQRYKKLLRFEWDEQMYEFDRLPNGLSQAPRLFTKLMKPVVGHLRSIGIMLVFYLDDILLVAESQEMASLHLQISKNLLVDLGFSLNIEKSSVEPSQNIEFLGFAINSVDMTLSLPHTKAVGIVEICQEMLSRDLCPLRQLAKVLGTLQAASPAIPTARLHVRRLQHLMISGLKKDKSYESQVKLSTDAQTDLQWWIDNTPRLTGVPIHPERQSSIEIFTDSSLTGYGAFCEGEGIQGEWPEKMQNLHINVLEMHAALIALKHFTKHVRGVHILMKVDNTTTLSYINKMGGTRVTVLVDLALEFWEIVLGRDLHLTAEYIPSKENVAADYLSRVTIQRQEWSLNHSAFRLLTQRWGTPEMDLFASKQNSKSENYISWKFQEDAWATDALRTPWPPMDLAYAFPEFNLIGRTLKKLEKSAVKRLILIAPAWKMQYWFPLLLKMLVEVPVRLPQRPDLLQDQSGGRHPLQERATLNLTAWMVSPNKQDQKDFRSKLPSISVLNGDRDQSKLTMLIGKHGQGGVIEDKLIPLNRL